MAIRSLKTSGRSAGEPCTGCWGCAVRRPCLTPCTWSQDWNFFLHLVADMHLFSWRLLREGGDKLDQFKACSFLSADFSVHWLICFRMCCQTANGGVCRSDQNRALCCHWKQVWEALVSSSPELQLLRLTVEHPLLRPRWMFPGIWLCKMVTGSVSYACSNLILILRIFTQSTANACELLIQPQQGVLCHRNREQNCLMQM